MKRFAIIFTIVAATAMIFSSCGKYEEGPAFSLMTKKARVVGTWTMVEMSVNGEVQDIEGLVIKSTMEKDGTGNYSYTESGVTVTSDLEWEFDEEKEHLRTRTKEVDETEFGDWEDGEILRLTNSECWVKTVYSFLSVEVETIVKLEKE